MDNFPRWKENGAVLGSFDFDTALGDSFRFLEDKRGNAASHAKLSSEFADLFLLMNEVEGFEQESPAAVAAFGFSRKFSAMSDETSRTCVQTISPIQKYLEQLYHRRRFPFALLWEILHCLRVSLLRADPA